MSDFNIERFKKGCPAQKLNGKPIKFIAILKNIPAPLIIEDENGQMQNYYLNGTFLSRSTPTEDDLEMMDLPLTAEQHKYVYP